MLWHAIQQNRAPLLTERLADADESEEDAKNRDLIEQMRSASADVLLPFVSGETVLGFLGLRDDRSPEPYSTAEIAKLMQIAETAATVIWNSKLMERLRERERLATVGAMAAGLAHEIRNPLGAIKGAAEYLDPGRFLEGDEAEFLQVIIDETNRLNSVVSQFLDYARPFRATVPGDRHQRGGPQDRQADPSGARREPSRAAARRAHAGDPRRRRADEAGGPQPRAQRARRLRRDRPVTISTRYVQERGCVELRVRDEGRGIPPEDLDRIFIPFFTTKQQGTGLGLAVCQRIVHNHGGTISSRVEARRRDRVRGGVADGEEGARLDHRIVRSSRATHQHHHRRSPRARARSAQSRSGRVHLMHLAGRTAALLAGAAALGFAINAARPDGVSLFAWQPSTVCEIEVAAAELTPDQAQAICADPNALVIDVRTHEQYARGHLPEALHLPCTPEPARRSNLRAALHRLRDPGLRRDHRRSALGRRQPRPAPPPGARARGRLSALGSRRARVLLRPVRRLPRKAP